MPGPLFIDASYLSQLLHQQQITSGMMLAAIAIAFGLGAAHALTPGHGKTIVAAYLVGSRGTVRHAVLLGAVVTLTHTITVFALGLCTMFLFERVVPQNVIRILSAISGLSIVLIGAWMVYRRLRHPHHHHHHHDDHDHGHDHHHHHGHDHGHHHHHAPASMRDLVAL